MIGETQVFNWPGGEHPFCLRIGELRALEQKCNAGLGVITIRLLGGQWYLDDILETLRLGLIGGGMARDEAARIVDRSLSSTNFYTLSYLASRLLALSVSWPPKAGDEEVDVGESKAMPSKPGSHSPMDGPDGPASSASPMQ
jgi:hypothetical protein